jgi:hypothetical protein
MMHLLLTSQGCGHNPNIGFIALGYERSRIHQFLWAYKDDPVFKLKDLGSLKGHEI